MTVLFILTFNIKLHNERVFFSHVVAGGRVCAWGGGGGGGGGGGAEMLKFTLKLLRMFANTARRT